MGWIELESGRLLNLNHVISIHEYINGWYFVYIEQLGNLTISKVDFDKIVSILKNEHRLNYYD